MRQKKRVRLAGFHGSAGLGRGQALVVRRSRHELGVGVAHHALGQHLGIQPGVAGQRALHQQLADADSETTANQLGEQEALRRAQLVPVGGDALCLVCCIGATQRQQPLLDPASQAHITLPARRRQHMGDGFGQVTHRLVAGVEQPVVDAGAAAGQFTQRLRGHHLARLAAGQEVHGPGRVVRFGRCEILGQRLHLGAGGGARIQLGKELREALHSSLSGVVRTNFSKMSSSPL